MSSTRVEVAGPTFSLRALGPLECRWDDTLLALGGSKQQMVLALLVLEANQPVSADRLIEWVWPGEAEPKNAAILQVYISNWRREFAAVAAATGRQLIVTRRPGYELQLDATQCDILRFDALRRRGDEAARGRNLMTAASTLRAALDLWRGEPFAGLPVEPEATARLTLAKVAVMEQLAEVELALGHHREVVDDLQTWVRELPLNETLRTHLMLALYRCGRQVEALATYRDGRRLLIEELGIDPVRPMREMEAKILAQSPSLDWSPAPSPRDLASTTEVRSSVIGPTAVLEMEGRTIGLDVPVFTVGRLPDRNLVLDDPGVSRAHAEIRRAGMRFVVADQGSANGTVINGQREVLHVLVDGDVIRFGGVEMTFRMLPD